MDSFKKVEAKWQKIWRAERIYEPDFRKAKKPFYNLMMFPYPSAEGLHVGNMYAFTGSDVYGRFKRMQGNDVFEPIGLDGFGIHSENYALKIGAHPMKQAKVSEKRFYEQLQMLGNGFAWNERLETYDADYYKWTQWIFIQMFKNGLAYRKKQPVNWCPSCKTVLADEQVIAGKCERCSSVVVKKELEQWFFRITKYAERLLKNLDWIDWSEKVKIAQRNWIGKSEGALIKFEILNSKFEIEVFTTRPDTLFGATYMVLASEHPFVASFLKIKNQKSKIKNYAEVKKYVENAKRKSEDIRLVENKEKTGVELKGVKAINPATKEEIPIWVADYVLMGYGTGAIMAVPAHDERDFEFTKKYKLPIRYVIEPVAGTKQDNPKEKQKIVVLVEDGDKVLTINWGNKGGRLFVGGTVEKGEDIVCSAMREVAEETGYYDLEFIAMSDEAVHYEYFSHNKNTQFLAHTKVLHFKLKNRKRKEQKLEDNEKGWFTVEWITKDQARKEVIDPLHRYAFDKFIDGKCYEGPGLLMNSEKFSGLDSETAKWEITKFVGGKRKIQYRLRDWLISRQRYWGPPIPMVYCENCAKKGTGEKKEMPGWYAVPEKSLPVRLPFVKDFRPKGKGESPLGTVKSFYETNCPNCRGRARRETDVSDTFLDSAWYFLRYPSVREKNNPWNSAATKKWLPVNMYIGGAEHSVLHLLYSRFLTMAFRDFGKLHFEEPFTKFRAHGLLIKEGAKMSKSKGNVVNPDAYIKKFGADTLRMYLMFLAPFEQGGDFRDAGILGVKRFLERVRKLMQNDPERNRTGQNEKQKNENLERLLQKTIKKVGEDIENLRYNTAVSALMILLNEIEKFSSILPPASYLLFLKLLAPFAPHIAEELWRKELGNKTSIHLEPWPEYNPKLIEENTFTLIIQVNGKVRDTLSAPADISENGARAMALESEKIKRAVEGKKVVNVIYVPRRLVNIVTKS